MLLKPENFYHPFKKTDLGFYMSGEYYQGNNTSFVLENIGLYHQPVEEPLMGIIKYSDGTYNKEELVGFTPSSEYEFIIEGKRLYRVLNKFITIKYEYQGNEKEYNPSWAQSS